MYAIVAQGKIVEMCENVRFVKINPETGVIIECPQDEARGIAAAGVAYNIRGGTVFDTPEAEYKVIDPGEVLEQTEYNRQGINIMIGAEEAVIDPDEELSYEEKLLHSFAASQQDSATLNSVRGSLDNFVAKIADSPAEINENPVAIRPWKEGAYIVGDVRMYEGNPYKCVQAHDSTGNPGWNPTVASLWMQYHGTSPETARPWIAPTGAQDMYRVGECMIWTDGTVYRCVSDTVYSPDAYGAAWEVIE